MVLQAATQDKLDDVDVRLAIQDGQILRPRDPQRCRHNTRQKCSYCLPIDPYDEEYLKEKEIKHMSFHAYVRKLMEGRGKGTQLTKPLENVRLLVDLKCAAHKPYPQGVCTKCRPPTITLNRQKYRHVDNIAMENNDLVNDFLDFWRNSSYQRVGFLIGKYEQHSEVPLGVKATVAAIYEPPQNANGSSVELLEEGECGQAVDRICDLLGLKRVGWIFTDLWCADRSKGTVHCTRHAQSYLLSAEEVITAASFQLKYPNRTQFCSDGLFGSKFVTVVASGDESEHIKFHGYQVSNQCCSLVEADLLCPTQHPELAYVRQTPLNEQHYITDVHFTEKNEYGAEVQRDGRPLPLEFLLVDVPAGTPKEQTFSFSRLGPVRFKIENRDALGQTQDGASVSEYCEAFSLNQFLEQASDFHFLVWLARQSLVRFTDAELAELCTAVKEQDRERAMRWAQSCSSWTQLVALSHSAAPVASSSSGGAAGWACTHCTFENGGAATECAMCGLPHSG